MAKQETHTETLAEHSVGHSPGPLSPSASMAILTWVTFFLLLAALYKFAWKPILEALQNREDHIRKSLADADVIQAQMAKLEATRQEILNEADSKAKEIVAESRKAAVQAAKTIEHKAKEESQIILGNARREIAAEENRVKASLKAESAKIAIQLAEKIIEENLDEKKNQKIISKMIESL